MVRWWTTKENIFWTYLAILKAVSGTLQDWVLKQNTNLDFQKTFDEPVANYLISEEFLERIGYISSYLPNRVNTIN